MNGLLLFLLIPVGVALADVCPPRLEDRTHLCTPKVEERERLSTKINSAVAAQREFALAQSLERDARENLRRIPPESPERASAVQAWSDSFDLANKRQSEAQTALESAAKDVQESYGIQPSKSGKVANGPFVGAEASWSLGVQVDRENAIRRQVTPDGEVRYLKFPKDSDSDERIAGITQDDGKVLLGIAAFEAARDHGPGALALTIYHESVHYAQLTTSGWETRAKTEAEAYAAEMAALKDIYVPSKTWRNRFFRAMSWNAIRAGEILLPVRTPAPFTPDSEDKRNRAEFEGTLADIRKEQSVLAHEVEQRAQERRERLRHAEETRRESRRMDAARANAESFRRLAETFCDTPLLADMSGQAIHEQWASALKAIDPPPNPLDIDEMEFDGTCVQYLINQALYAKKAGRDSSTPEWLSAAVREGILRSKGARPLFERLRASPPHAPSPTPTAPPDPPTTGGGDGGEDPPSPSPSVPWCLQEPGRRCIR